MYTPTDKSKEDKDQSDSNGFAKIGSSNKSNFQFLDNRPEALMQRKLQTKVFNANPENSKLDKTTNIEGTMHSLNASESQNSPDYKVQFSTDDKGLTIQRINYDVVPSDDEFISNARDRNRGTYAKIKGLLKQVNQILSFLISNNFSHEEKLDWADKLVTSSLPKLIGSCEHHLRDDKNYFFNQTRHDNSTALLSGAQTTMEYVTKFIEQDETEEEYLRDSDSFKGTVMNEIDFMEELDIVEKSRDNTSVEMNAMTILGDDISIGSEEVEKGYASMEPEQLLDTLNHPEFFNGFREQLLYKLLGERQTPQVTGLLMAEQFKVINNILLEEAIPSELRSRLIPLFFKNRKEAVKQSIISIHGLDGPDGYTGNKACEAAATVLNKMVKGPWVIRKRVEGGLASHYFLQDGDHFIDGTWKQFLAEYLTAEDRAKTLEELPNIFVGTLNQLRMIYEENTNLSEEEIDEELNIWELAE